MRTAVKMHTLALMSPVMKERRVMKKKVTRVAAAMKRSMQLVSLGLYLQLLLVYG